MKLATLLKLDLMAAAEEAKLLEQLGRHTTALQTYKAQSAILENYKARLAAGWQSGKPVRAGEALRAGQFSQQAEHARAQLAHSIASEEAQRHNQSNALTTLRARREKLQARIKSARQADATQKDNRAERHRPAVVNSAFPAPHHLEI